jgi:hypothetical protein
MSGRTVRSLRAGATIALGVAMFVALAAPLPGELQGCGGDTSGEVSKVEYCRDKCDVEADKLEACGLTTERDAVYAECIRSRQCADPNLCVGYTEFFISNGEADACFTAILRMSCGAFTVDGLSYDYTGPGACSSEEICDPI